MKLTIFKLFLSANLLIVVTLFCSCNVYFNSPQPSWVTKNEKVIPRKFRGTYLKPDLMDHGTPDTICITEKRIVDNLKHHNTDFTLSDSVVLRIYHHAYFLNLYDSEEMRWIIIMAKKEKQNILYSMIPSEDSIIPKLKKITKVEDNVLYNDDKKYYINPSPEEFRKILKANLFAVMDTLKKIKP